MWRGGRHPVNCRLASLLGGKGERWIQRQMVESQTKEKEDNQEQKCDFCSSSFFTDWYMYILEGLHKNLTDSLYGFVLSVGKACPCTGIILTSLCVCVCREGKEIFEMLWNGTEWHGTESGVH